MLILKTLSRQVMHGYGIAEHIRQTSADVLTVEEGSLAGGFGSALAERCVELGLRGFELQRIGIPDEYVSHGSQDILRAQYDLHPEGIASRVRKMFATDAGSRLAVS